MTIHWRGDVALGVEETTAQEASKRFHAETLAGTDEKAEDRSAIVSDEVHGAIEALFAKGANEGQAAVGGGVAASAGEGPDFVNPGYMFQEWSGFGGHQHVKLGIGPTLVQGPQGGGHHHDVAEVFEIDGENFQRVIWCDSA